MIKNIFILSAFTLLGFGIFATPAQAFPSPEEMQANYEMCQSDSDWYRNWGQYVVAFDIYAAAELCRENFSHQRPKLAPCMLNGEWVFAGYYCEEITGGVPNR